MNPKDKKSRISFKRLKAVFTNNLAVKIVSVFFAMLLWGYVLTDQKPMRAITLADVPTSFEGEAELLAQSLCVRGNRQELLKNVSVTVRAQIMNYTYITPNVISATVNLRNISEARTYTLPVSASISSGLGVVQTVAPATLDVEIDTLVTKTVPVTTSYTGAVPEGYYADMDSVTTTTRIDIQGPKTDVANVVRAECIVPLDGQSTTIYRTFDVVLYDADGDVVSGDILIGTLPTSTVRVPIYPMKTVPVNVTGSLIGTDNLAANHVLYSAVATPEEIRIVGSQAALDLVDAIELEPISVSGMNAAATITAEIVLPDGVRVLDDEPVTVNLDVRESTMKQDFAQIPIEVAGLGKGLTATLSLAAVDVSVEGRYSLVSLINRRDVAVSVDVTGLDVGTHTLPISLTVLDGDSTVELSTTLSSENVVAVITN